MNIIQSPLQQNLRENICLFVFLALAMLSSCSSKKSVLFKSANEIELTGTNPNEGSEIYKSEARIKEGNILSITNIQNESAISGLGVSTPLEIKYLVDIEGNVKLPILGTTHVAGLTIQEAEKEITNKYKETTLLDPLFVVKILNMQVSLLGEFVKQGNYPLNQENVSLTESIAEAGGFNARADKSKVKIVRGNPKNPQVYLVDLTKLQTLTDSKLYLKDGDIVYCQPRKIFTFTDQAAPFFSYISVGTVLVNIIFLLTR